MNIFRKMRLKIQIVLRTLAFERGRKMGMTEREARAYVDGEHPLTPAEAAYERDLLRKKS